ncbi:hypothetical protein QFC20_000236 [Naganishia adeliensis]|uniref:Uncharacterized protein n=1 Tax=Naganishia adeliensis TaxID=92952 RepID=A0ACC2X1N6_9TREE|nr:hypothetical protein QFC20_000236 [Naganishia adeliensis]
MSAPRLTLAQQLKRLEEDDERPVVERDLEAEEELQGWTVGGEGEYGDVGTSTLRDKTASTLSHLDAKYNTSNGNANNVGGERKKVKVFDDDLSEEDEETIVRGEDGWGMDSDAQDGENSEDDSEEDSEDDSEEEDEEEDEEDEEEEEDEEPQDRPAPAKPTRTTLDPLASLQASKSKEVMKGRAILRQQKLFDELLTVRITFQKAWVAGAKVPSRKRKARELDSSDETDDLTTSTLATHRTSCLAALGSLSEDLFVLRERVARCLPGYTAEGGEVKRRKVTDDEDQDVYWKACAVDSLAMLDSTHDTLLTTLTKWSTKIQAASIQQAMLAGKAGNGNKFSAGAGQAGVVEAIDGALNSKALSHADGEDEPFTSEDGFYKSLLREVIEARAAGTGGASGIDVGQLRSEKKKKRDAERGASKGRKLRYTVHEKAQNFTVPIPLSTPWATEQIDELFTSLLGGAGLAGAGAERDDQGVMGVDAQESGLSGLRVF